MNPKFPLNNIFPVNTPLLNHSLYILSSKSKSKSTSILDYVLIILDISSSCALILFTFNKGLSLTVNTTYSLLIKACPIGIPLM